MEILFIILPIFISFFMFSFALRIVPFLFDFFYFSSSKDEEPKVNQFNKNYYKVVYRTKPIQGIRLELVSKK